MHSTPPERHAPRPQRLAGVLFAMGAAVIWSAAGVGIKLLPLSAPAIAGFRSLFALPVLWAALLLRSPEARSASFYPFALRQPSVWAGGAAYALCVTLFVLATRLTTAANAILFQYSAPIYVAILSWPLLRERVRPIDWLAVGGCLFGMAFCFAARLSASGWLGNALALLSGLGFGLLPLVWRRQLAAIRADSELLDIERRRHLPDFTLVLGNVLAAGIALPFMLRDLPSRGSVWLGVAALGAVQIGVAYLLYGAAVRRLRAVESLVAATLEPILNPLWVALWAHEQPERPTLIGGSIILGTVILHGLLASAAPNAGSRAEAA
jgi:drug/metabolite transporter (DMT)-like permease